MLVLGERERRRGRRQGQMSAARSRDGASASIPLTVAPPLCPLESEGCVVSGVRFRNLRAEPAEDIVHDRLGEPDIRVVGDAGRLEARMGELVHQRLQRHAVLQRQRDRGRERVHQAGDRRAFLAHRQEDLARRAVLVHADRDVAFVPGDAELVRDAVRARPAVCGASAR